MQTRLTVPTRRLLTTRLFVVCVVVSVSLPVCAQTDVAPRARGVDLSDAAVPPPGSRWALLIGINKYEHMPALRYCSHDMEQLRDVLIEHGGYQRDHVRLLSDQAKDSESPSRGNLLLALNDFLQQAKPEDTVLVAFSGHGDRDPQDHSYLLPIDASPKLLADTAVSMAKVHEYLQTCQARQKIIILDACHSGGQKGEDVTFDPAQWPHGEGLLEMFSCDVAQSSWEDPDIGQGVFSYYLARALEGEADLEGNKDGLVTSDEVYNYVYKHTKDYVSEKMHRQQFPKLRGELEGKIVLAARSSDEEQSGLEPKRIDELLERANHERKISAELLANSHKWLIPLAASMPAPKGAEQGVPNNTPNDFPPARDVKLGLSLLAQGALTEAQFQTLCYDRCRQVDSHNAAESEFGRRHVKAVCIGIDHYGAHQIGLCVSDAKFIADILRRSAGVGSDDLTVLTESAATVENVTRAITSASHSLQPGDLLIVSFAGLGWKSSKATETGWLLSKAKTDPPKQNEATLPHRGLDLPTGDEPSPQLQGVGDGFGMTELEKLFSEADVLVVSDTCYADPLDQDHLSAHELSVTDKPKGDDAAVAKAPSRVFIYSPDMAVAYSDIEHGVITYLVARGLSGAADKQTPESFDPAKANSSLIGISDGFVSLKELVSFCRENCVFRGRDFVKIKGQFGDRDAIVCRSSLVTH
jgi:uncharacterized caspase-like protein